MELRPHEKKWLCPECGSHKEPNDDGLCQDCTIAWPSVQFRYNCPMCDCEIVHDLMVNASQDIPYGCGNEHCDWYLGIELHHADRDSAEVRPNK